MRSKQTQSFDHLVGKLLQVQRHVEIKRFRGFEIYHQLKLGRLLDREVFGRNAAEDLDNQTRQLAIDKRKTRAVSDQTALFRHFRPFINRGQAQGCGPLDDDPAIKGKQWRGQHVKSGGTPRPWS